LGLLGLDLCVEVRKTAAMMRWNRALWGCAFAFLVSGCGGPDKAKSADDVDAEDDRKWEDGPTKWDDSAGSDDTPVDNRSGEKVGKKPAPVPDDYEMTPADCEALSQNYRNVLYRSLKEKLDAAKLPPKQLSAQEQKIIEQTEDGTEKWLQQCHTIVNKVQVRSRLQCALDAKELERFDGCWEGKFDNEAGQ
jgi:hypothetical protein